MHLSHEHLQHGLVCIGLIAVSNLLPEWERIRAVGTFCGGVGTLLFAVLAFWARAEQAAAWARKRWFS